MTKKRLHLGKKGEDFAVKLLKKNAYKIKKRNYCSPVGEIDVIAVEGDTLVFVEVKTRSNCSFGMPEEAVSIRKQQQITRTAMYYLQSIKKEDIPARFDVVSVIAEGSGFSGLIIKNAFDTF